LVKGSIDAENKVEVASELRKQGYIPIDIGQGRQKSAKTFFSIKRRVKQEELILFTRQFTTIVKTGVPLVRGLQTLREQSESDEMRTVLDTLLKDIQKGSSLGEAMRKHPGVFSPTYYNTVKAGESSGRLEEILGKLADLLEYELKVKEEIKSATRYPILVIVIMILACTVLITFVIPKFMTVFARFEMELPLPTRILIGLNTYVHEYWMTFLMILIGMVVGLRYYIRTERGSRQWDQLKLSMPIIGSIKFKGIMSRFARIFATLSGSGIPVLEALDIVRHAVGNLVISDRIKKIQTRVMEGTGIASPMTRIGGFPPLLVQMISIGEETGALEEMLIEVSRHYETEVDYQLRRLTVAIEPVLIVFLGGMVLLLALAVFMPLWNMVSTVRQ
jgi:type II secretory pathway component PulF